MDWHSRYVLAWRLSNTLEVDFCVAALEEALSKGRPQIFNTDQGSLFTSEAFTSMLLAQGVQVSMDGRGRCMDNVFVERLWRSIKYEEVYLKAYQNGTEARKGIGAYLAFYNQERPHQALGYRSPSQVFQSVSPQRCLLEHPRALPSDEGLRDTPAVDSLILATCPDDGVHLTLQSCFQIDSNSNVLEVPSSRPITISISISTGVSNEEDSSLSTKSGPITFNSTAVVLDQNSNAEPTTM